MSATKSASTGMPYLKPKLITVTLSRGRVGRAERLRDPVGELVDVEVGGVDDQVGVAAEVGQHLALAPEPVEQPAAGLERVGPARRLLAADQHLVGGVEEQQRRVRGRSRPGRGWPAGSRRTPRTGRRPRPRSAGSVPRLSSTRRTTSRSRRRREVVDDVVAEVLQLLGGRAAAGAGHAGDDDDLAGVLGGRSTRWRRRGSVIGHHSSRISPVAVFTVWRPVWLPARRPHP